MGKIAKKLERSLFYFDFFGEQVGFSVNGQKSHKSYEGTIISLGILATVLSFAVNKFILSITHSDTMHTTAVEKNYFDESTEYKFDSFHAAFALIEHSTLEPVQDLERFMTLTVAQEEIENADYINA